MASQSYFMKKSAAAIVDDISRQAQTPMSAMIEIADRCNEVCVHCYQIQGQKGEMSTDEIKKILRDMADAGILFLTISGGEATLRKDFLDIVSYARALRFAVKIYTNGLTMTESMAESLSALAVQEVQISLYSHKPEVHDDITGVHGSFVRTVAAVRYLVEKGVATVVKTPMMTFNAKDYAEYMRFVKGLGADYSLAVGGLDARENGDTSPVDFSSSHNDIKRVLQDPMFMEPVAEGMKPKEKPLDSRVCGACHGNVHVEANGEIRPCTLLDVSCGNAREQSVGEAWQRNPNAVSIRNMSWGDIHGCRDCDLRNYCSRCFAQSRSLTGDAVGPYQQACDNAKLFYEVLEGVALTCVRAGDAQPNQTTGPYKRITKAVFEIHADCVTDEDRKRYERIHWLRQKNDAPKGEVLVPLRIREMNRRKKPAEKM